MIEVRGVEALRAVYPETAGLVRHDLADHPMLSIDALARLAERLPQENVEYNSGRLPIGIAFEDVPANGLSIAETLAGIEHNGSWLVLKFIEHDDAYRALLAETLARFDPAIDAKTGPMLKQEGFIFVSSPGAVTPLHFDPEHNLLLQLRGTKSMTVFPADDETIAPPDAHERLHAGTGHRNLVWDERFAARGRTFELAAGDGLYVPVMAPHWVQNGREVSVSFSVTWRSAFSYAEAEARGMNAILRRAGLSPRAPKRFPARNLMKSTAFRAVRKGRRMFGGA